MPSEGGSVAEGGHAVERWPLHAQDAEVHELDVRSTHGTFDLIFEFRDARLTFVVNVGTAARQRPSVRARARCAAAAIGLTGPAAAGYSRS